MAKANPFRFSTKFQDDETDLLYYGLRYYNASTGRWLSQDPISERGGLNLYAFGMNSPIQGVDGLGLDWLNSRPMDFIECMGRCVEANDPLNTVFDKVVLSLEGMTLPKTLVAKLASLAGDEELAQGILKSLKNPANSRLTTLPGTIAAALRADGKTSSFLHAFGDGLSPFWLSYGLYMAQVEAACAGHCTCSRHYDPAGGIWLPLDVNKLIQQAVSGIMNLASPAPPETPGYTGPEP
jgi:RHS repeat-associated protein